MIPLLEPVALTVKTTDMLLPLLLSDVTDETSRRRIRSGEGPSIAWEVGHLLEYRCDLLKLLGVVRERSFALDFTAAGATDGLDYPTMAELRAAWSELHVALIGALETADEASVRRQTPVRGAALEMPALDAIVGFTWHEAYHVGALVALRKALGLAGLKELAASKPAD